MRYCKGRVAAVHQHGGCLEVVVEGESPGAFPIDNCCVWSIVGTEGTDWIGREVEYADGMMRFTDSAESASEDPPTQPQPARLLIPT